MCRTIPPSRTTWRWQRPSEPDARVPANTKVRSLNRTMGGGSSSGSGEVPTAVPLPPSASRMRPRRNSRSLRSPSSTRPSSKMLSSRRRSTSPGQLWPTSGRARTNAARARASWSVTTPSANTPRTRKSISATSFMEVVAPASPRGPGGLGSSGRGGVGMGGATTDEVIRGCPGRGIPRNGAPGKVGTTGLPGEGWGPTTSPGG
jgi:hypothetical protein